MKEWLTAAEIAAAKLPELPSTERGVQLSATRENWRSRPREGRGGGSEYHLPTVGTDVYARYLVRASKPLSIVASKAAPAAALPQSITDDQCRIAEARLALLRELERIASETSLNYAIKAMVELAAGGALPAHLQALVGVANARAGGKSKLSRRTLLRWRKQSESGAKALAPRDGKREAEIPAWGASLLRQNPQKKGLRQVLALMAASEPDAPLPSYDQARRFLKGVSVIERNRGRMGPHALKTLRAFRRRDVSGLDPLDVGVMDGHQFDAEVAHPVHGGPFRPEITGIVDAATRKLIGWSVDLAESAHTVMDAIRHASVTHGALGILYVDRGSGYEADVISAQVTGLLARLGTRHETGLPRNSQARGLIERMHQSVWVRAARELPTFIGADMDADAAKKIHKLTRNAIAGAGRALLMPWRDFLNFAGRQAEAYNARSHRGLPRRRDSVSGSLRHLSPNEAWQAALARGWAPMTISEEEAIDLFRPAREVVTRRGEVRLFGNLYFNRDLEHRTGERLMVSYDIHDPKLVWVKDLEGRLLCTAALDGNKSPMFPRSVIDQARDQRAAQRERRLMIHLEEVRAERGPREIDADYAEIDAETEALAAEQLARLAPPPANDQPVENGARPIFRDDESFARWCLANPERMSAGDREFFAELMKSKSFRLLLGIEPQQEGGAF